MMESERSFKSGGGAAAAAGSPSLSLVVGSTVEVASGLSEGAAVRFVAKEVESGAVFVAACSADDGSGCD